ncbi:tRNA (cytidine(34)-2'-O)-methyltransferase [Kordiimonas pumila]|uniref:tRNA (cytidine(34)-2'-O)-methyltransferase n=1 Tax=Kordiimonas pumila TaxID=2161677 RepID=A0ABV7D8U2_9PROT|nr:tRNA (cytidine(34)-2'-O)-methyltransferase [Kordiimonas pumila]
MLKLPSGDTVPLMQIALFQPDQPTNTGTLLRLGACMGTPVHIIEPCGFPFSKRALRRYAMDYADHVTLHHHADWHAFQRWRIESGSRLLLLTTKSAQPYHQFTYQPDDILMVGSESTGAPDYVHDIADHRLLVPMTANVRSLNVAVSMAMVLGEGLRQTDNWPEG